MVTTVVRGAAETSKCCRDGVPVPKLLGQLETLAVLSLRARVVALGRQDSPHAVERKRQAPPILDRLEERHTLFEQRPRTGEVAVGPGELREANQRMGDAAPVGKLPEQPEALLSEYLASRAVTAVAEVGGVEVERFRNTVPVADLAPDSERLNLEVARLRVVASARPQVGRSVQKLGPRALGARRYRRH